MYATSFEEIRAAPTPNSRAREEHFAELLERIYTRHSAVLLTMARSAYELRADMGSMSFIETDAIHRFLDSFYMSRIGIRMLIGQYLALREEKEEGYVGLVSQFTSPAEVAKAAIEDAEFMCTRQHGDAPIVTLHGRLDLNFQYVPTHLHYILLELLKNSMRATVEFHGVDDMPPIRVVIADGESNEDIVIKVSDEGGGIPRSHAPRIWSYLFTTADPSVQQGAIGGGESDFDTGSPLAGLGYGLPISRAYARYFGGQSHTTSSPALTAARNQRTHPSVSTSHFVLRTTHFALRTTRSHPPASQPTHPPTDGHRRRPELDEHGGLRYRRVPLPQPPRQL